MRVEKKWKGRLYRIGRWRIYFSWDMRGTTQWHVSMLKRSDGWPYRWCIHFKVAALTVTRLPS